MSRQITGEKKEALVKELEMLIKSWQHAGKTGPLIGYASAADELERVKESILHPKEGGRWAS